MGSLAPVPGSFAFAPSAPVDAGWPLLVLDLVGVFAFGLSGGLAAVRRSFDIFGVLVLSCSAGLGGGVLRDVLIGAVPPVGITDPRLFSAACAAGVVTFFLHPRVSRIRRTVLLLDAIGLGVFAVAGTYKALSLGIPVLAAVIVGVLTGIGGGAIRDLLCGEVPEVLGRAELYATPALLGSVAIAVAWQADVVSPPVTVACVSAVVALRLWALRFKVTAPTPRPPGTMTR